MKRIKFYGKAWLLFVFTLVLLSGCAQKSEISITEKTRQVEGITLVETTYNESMKYTGFITSKQLIPFSFSRDGKIEEILVNEGDTVKTGDPLAKIESNPITQSDGETIYSGIDGIVVEIVNRPSDLIGSGRPVVFVREKEQILNVGMTQNDIFKMESFSSPKVEVLLNDKIYKGYIWGINHIPDEKSRTYEVSIGFDKDTNFLLGQVVDANIELKAIKGIWLSIGQIQNDGEDFVFVVNDQNRVERKNLILYDLNKDKVRVEGIEAGLKVITVGNAYVKEGQLVMYKEASDD